MEHRRPYDLRLEYLEMMCKFAHGHSTKRGRRKAYHTCHMDNIRLKRRHKEDRKEYQENQKEMLP